VRNAKTDQKPTTTDNRKRHPENEMVNEDFKYSWKKMEATAQVREK